MSALRVSPRTRRTTFYMHTLDGKPASFSETHGYQGLAYARHRGRAAQLVDSLDQIRREQQRCLACDWRDWNTTNPEYRGAPPSLNRYGYVRVEVPS